MVEPPLFNESGHPQLSLGNTDGVFAPYNGLGAEPVSQFHDQLITYGIIPGILEKGLKVVQAGAAGIRFGIDHKQI